MVANQVFVKTTVYMLLTLGIGYALRKAKLLGEDEGALSKYVIYVAMPALVLSNLSSVNLDLKLLRVLLTYLLSMAVISSLIYLAGRVMGSERSSIYLFILTANFSNAGFFGIPFISITFSELEALQLSIILCMATLIPSSILCFLLLESLREGGSLGGALIRTMRSPLMASVVAAIIINLTGLKIPKELAFVLDSLGATASPLALVSVGTSLTISGPISIREQAILINLRAFLSPMISMLIGLLAGLYSTELSVLVLMSAMPAAVLLGVFSNEYDFHRNVVSSLITISSLAAPLYLNIWLYLLKLLAISPA
ncbi:MAG: AEC family transporter [Candidatus Korarchaeum sp.]|nr:AEC family transporter [Candidatus Korarchaeum sp.]